MKCKLQAFNQSSATLSKRYCKLCTRYFPTQAALKRLMKAKVCSVIRPARLDEEYIVRRVPEAEHDDDEAVLVVAVVLGGTHFMYSTLTCSATSSRKLSNFLILIMIFNFNSKNITE